MISFLEFLENTVILLMITLSVGWFMWVSLNVYWLNKLHKNKIREFKVTKSKNKLNTEKPPIKKEEK